MPDALKVPVSTGGWTGGGATVTSKGSEPVPAAFVAKRVPPYTPTVASVPDTNPVTLLTDKPGARPDAPNAVGAFVAVI